MAEDDIDALIEGLSPEAKLVVAFLRQQHREQAKQHRGQVKQHREQVKQNKTLLKQNENLSEQLERLTEQVAKFQAMLFGRRSERIPTIDEELRAEKPAPEQTVDGAPMPEGIDEAEKEKRRHARKNSESERKKRRAKKKSLPVVEIPVTVADDQIPSGMTRADFRVVGTGTVVERTEHVPSHYVIHRYLLETLAAKDSDLIIKAVAPRGVSEGCQYGPGAHAYVVTAKCCDSMPLHRIEKKLSREGNTTARSTLCSMFHRTAGFLEPIYDGILGTVRRSFTVHADETTLPVQAEGKCKRGWIWTLLSVEGIVYHYDDSRSGSVATSLLGEGEGNFVVDGYSGYNKVEGNGRSRAGCWSHARRKFFEAMTSAPESREVLDLIRDLYKVERECAKEEVLGTPLHQARRTAQSAPLFDKINAWVTEKQGRYPPKNPMGQALQYFTNQKVELGRFLADVTIPLDNNVAERALRIFALGRKNFLFAGHAEGAQNLAILQSIVSTCQLHGVNPYDYITDVLIQVQIPGVTLDDLMPWNWQSPEAA